ncbi:hypothetical protein N8I71_16040 [Roseibacterium sp. SDUM158016]|jgi:hypothetical protein|uniref:hypothetical protein n=1 Tax=Roseicyclus sediminis TaxID=2980997 RepID=UPI0021D1BF49|nr:hypothetical protein [Roseibacterium sp. SDUM158016]MCU4654351.1 hypothetical protein [Roseibacterium sp. SDUM158016]
MTKRFALLAALFAAILAAIYGTARAEDEIPTTLGTVTAPSPVSPFDPAIIERIRQAILASEEAEVDEGRDE